MVFGQVEVLTDGVSVRYTLFDAAGTRLWTSTTATNSPVPRATGHGLICYRSNATAGVLMHVDYMDLQMGVLVR